METTAQLIYTINKLAKALRDEANEYKGFLFENEEVDYLAEKMIDEIDWMDADSEYGITGNCLSAISDATDVDLSGFDDDMADEFDLYENGDTVKELGAKYTFLLRNRFDELVSQYHNDLKNIIERKKELYRAKTLLLAKYGEIVGLQIIGDGMHTAVFSVDGYLAHMPIEQHQYAIMAETLPQHDSIADEISAEAGEWMLDINEEQALMLADGLINEQARAA